MTTEAPAFCAQFRIWQIQQEMPDRQFLPVSTAVRISGPLDVDALRRALAALTARHDSLRSRFAMRGAVLHQVADDHVETPLRLHAVAPGEDPLRDLRAAASEPIDLSRSPVWRADLLLEGDDEAVLSLHVHHAVIDGEGMRLLLSELGTLYRAARDGTGHGLEPAPSWLADLRERYEHLSSPEYQAELAYWRGLVGEVPMPARLPGSRPAGAVPRGTGRSIPDRVLGPEVTEGLRALGRRRRATLAMTVTGCVAAALARVSGSPTISIATAFAGRRWAGSERTIGNSVCSLPIVLHDGPDPGVDDLVDQARDQFLVAVSDPTVSFENLGGSEPYWPDIYHAVLTVIEGSLPQDGLQFAGTECRPVDIDVPVMRFAPLMGVVAPADGSLRVWLVVDGSTYVLAEAERALDTVVDVLTETAHAERELVRP